MEQAIERKLTLYDLIQTIGFLEDNAEAVPEELQLQLKIATEETLTAKGDKVDAYASFIVERMRLAASAKAEIEVIKAMELGRLKKREARAEADADRLTRLALWIIRGLPRDAKGKLAKLEGHKYTLAAKGLADSIDPEGYDETLIPLEYKVATVTHRMPASVWKEYSQTTLREAIDNKIGIMFETRDFDVTFSVDKSALLKALKQPCQGCGGLGEVNGVEPVGGPEPVQAAHCPKCGGAGTQRIPGARLLTNKLWLAID